MVCEGDLCAAHGDAMRIHDAVGPARRAIYQGPQRSVPSDRAAIDAPSTGKVALRRGHQHVITQERDGRTIRVVEAVTLYAPARATIAARAQARGGGGHHDVGATRVSSYLVNIRLDFDRWLPARAGIRRA